MSCSVEVGGANDLHTCNPNPESLEKGHVSLLSLSLLSLLATLLVSYAILKSLPMPSPVYRSAVQQPPLLHNVWRVE